jgi:uncharacterized membrane protein YbaN (DUF454 family)
LAEILAMRRNSPKPRTIRDSDSATMFIVEAAEEADRNRITRLLFLALGWICVAIGIIGVVVPGMPGTVFLLIAVWAFSRSSRKLHRWLFEHPRWRRSIRAWHLHRAIPTVAKVLAVAGMAAGVVSSVLFIDGGWGVPVALSVVMIPFAAFIVTRPGGPGTPTPTPG